MKRDFSLYTLVEYQYQWRTLHSGKTARRKVKIFFPFLSFILFELTLQLTGSRRSPA
jgi:hypothetical protein